MCRILAGADYMDMSHGTSTSVQEGNGLRVHIVQPGTYCARVADVLGYGEVNREVADSSQALHLSGLHASKFDNIVPPSTTIGNKTTITAACIVGENCVLGDKSSIKRSVLGHNCK